MHPQGIHFQTFPLNSQPQTPGNHSKRPGSLRNPASDPNCSSPFTQIIRRVSYPTILEYGRPPRV